MAERYGEEDIALRRDEPVTSVDLLEMEESGLLALGAGPTAVLYESLTYAAWVRLSQNALTGKEWGGV